MRLTRDRWYSKDGQRKLHQRAHQESTGTRKIISLVLLLLMILAVMQQLAEPRKYEPILKSIGLTQPLQPNLISNAFESNTALVDQPALNVDNPSGERLASTFNGASDSTIRTSQSDFLIPDSMSIELFMQMWQRLFDLAPHEVIHEFSKAEFVSTSLGIATAESGSTPSITLPVSLSPEGKKWLDEARLRVQRWQSEYESIDHLNPSDTPSQNTTIELQKAFVAQCLAWASLLEKNVKGASTALDPDIRSGLQLALDRCLLKILRDASPWRPQERPVLARTFQRALDIRGLDHAAVGQSPSGHLNPPLVEVISLSKQTNDLRGQTIRLRGQPVTNPESATQNVEGWGEFRYDVVWIRPNDNSQQPVCVYAMHAPPGGWPVIKSSADSSSKDGSHRLSDGVDSTDAPLIELSGILVKRLAYPSKRGVDVSPLLVAFDVRWLSNELTLPSIAPSDVTEKRTARIRTPRWIEPGEQAENLSLLRDIFASDLESLADEETQSKLTDKVVTLDISTETPQLAQILYQLPRMERPLQAALVVGQKIGPSRLDVFHGWVREIEEITLAKITTASGEASKIYRLRIEPPVNGSLPRINQYAFVNQIPSEWKPFHQLSQPISLSGLYWETTIDRTLTRCWIADHVNWSWPWLVEKRTSSQSSLEESPSTGHDVGLSVSQEFVPEISNDWKNLGAIGFDLSRIDFLRSLRGKPISSSESQAFYPLIDCADRLDKSRLQSSDSLLSAIDCLQENSPMLRRVHTRVEIIRATRIVVSDEFDQNLLGGDAYYELDGLAKLGNLAIQMKSPEGKENIVFQGEYPITLVSKEIPLWLSKTEAGAMVLSDQSFDKSTSSTTGQVSQPAAVWYPKISIDVEGVFYRLWSFSTAQTSSLNRSVQDGTSTEFRLKQIGPLVAVTKWGTPTAVAAPPPRLSIVRDLLTALGFVAICIYGYYRISVRRSV